VPSRLRAIGQVRATEWPAGASTPRQFFDPLQRSLGGSQPTYWPNRPDAVLLREPIQGGDADLRLQRIERFQDDVKSILIAAIVGLAVSIMLTPYLIRFFSSGGVTIRGATGAFESVIPDYVASEPQAYRCRALPFPKASDD